MGDKPNSAPGDSFAGRLNKAIKDDKAAPPSAVPPQTGSSESPPGTTDSFTNRLAGAIGSKKAGEDYAKDSHAGTAGPARVELAPLSPDDEPSDASPERPVGAGEIVARPGDCVVSLADAAGHHWKTVWDDAANADLRALRKDPCVLLSGDRVHIPPLRPKQESGMSEQRHRFRRKGQPEAFQVRILRDDEPRSNQPYSLDVDGEILKGTTDAEGKIVRIIKPTAKRAILTVGSPDDEDRYVLRLGGLDPIDTTRGVQQRLNNLGFDCGSVDGQIGPETRAALRRFQRSRDLPASGAADDATRSELQRAYGC